jgi:hypothetical protein
MTTVGTTKTAHVDCDSQRLDLDQVGVDEPDQDAGVEVYQGAPLR